MQVSVGLILLKMHSVADLIKFSSRINGLTNFRASSLGACQGWCRINCPLLMDMDLPKDGPIPFRFEDMWL